MSKKQYKEKLSQAIKEHGYWSNEVYELNNEAIKLFGVTTYQKLQDSVRASL